MARPLDQQTVVLTGASSGIGRATAAELARRGANLVLAARTEEALRDVAREVEAVGGKTLVVPTDVADRAQVDRLARAAVSRFGRIDTWINDAAVSMYATVEDATVEEMERIIRVDLLGAIYGMKAALPVMRRQNEGTIVNVSSVLGEFSVPLQSAYCASKHGLIGFADSLRLELKREGSPVEVVTVLPGSTNTPFFDHARSKLGGKKPQPIPPVYEPEAVARAVAHVCEHPQRDVVIGLASKMFVWLNRIEPRLVDWFLLSGDSGAKLQTSDRPHDGRDNLSRPLPGPQPAHGAFGDKIWNLGGSEYTQLVELRPWTKAAVAGAVLAGAAGLIGWLASRPGRSAYTGSTADPAYPPAPETLAYAG